MIETLTAPAPVEVRPKTPQELGEHAARYIEEHGWCQNAIRDDGGQVCLLGALNAANDGTPFGMTPFPDDLYRRLGQRLGGSVVQWNNAAGRTREEVIAVLRAIR